MVPFALRYHQPPAIRALEIQEGYAFVWEANQRQTLRKIIAVARPHHFVRTGEGRARRHEIMERPGRIARYDWTFTDGTKATGPTVERTYSQPGYYSEVLKITDARGEIDYDFAVVDVIDGSAPNPLPPTIHPAFAPTTGIRAGDQWLSRCARFKTTFGNETWDFGDGSEKVTVKSDGNVNMHAKDGRRHAASVQQSGPIPRPRRADQ